MVRRSIYVPSQTDLEVRDISLEFDWYPGFSVSQKRKSIASLHAAARDQGIGPVLEISSKSAEESGVQASAFNLLSETPSGKTIPVEVAFQASKVTDSSGPFPDIYEMTSREAKQEIRNRIDGPLKEFNFFGHKFPLEPKTYFYDWLYIKALHRDRKLAGAVSEFSGFTDIEFNPKKSINCQAYSAALYVALKRTGYLDRVLKSSSSFLDVLQGSYSKRD